MYLDNPYHEDVAAAAGCIPQADRLFGKRFLISGSTGMICSSVVEILTYLNEQYNAGIQLILAGRNKERISKRFMRDGKSISFDFVQFDATVPTEMDCQADFIIHGAGDCSPDFYGSHPAETIKNNIVGVQSLLELAKKNPGSRLLYLSSSEVYGNRTGETQQKYREDEYGYVDILNPRACYPCGKRTAETLCSCYSDEYGVDTVIARPGHIYGPYFLPSNTRASTLFTLDAVYGKDIVMKSAGMQLRSYCYSLDCASALLSILLKGETGKAYNISNPDSIVTIRELAEEFAKCGGVKIVFDNPSDRELKGYNLMSNAALDSSRLEALGWKGKFDLETGVRRTFDITRHELLNQN